MENNRKQLLKHFSITLKKLSIADENEKVNISESLLHYFSRKELIEIIKTKYNGTIPKTVNLVEAENKDLLHIIENELYVIAYATEKWSREVKKVEPIKPPVTESLSEKTDQKVGQIGDKKIEVKTEKTSTKTDGKRTK